MDAKDLRTETALGERNDGSKYSQSGVAPQYSRIRSYHDIGSNALGKAEATVRPCAVIEPDRVVPPALASTDPFLKKASVELWNENVYPRPPEYHLKPLSNVNPTRNISPRQTFQENMQRIMVPPTYSAVKHTDESIYNHSQDRNVVLTKIKSTIVPEAKYCDVPYPTNLLTNEHKSARETEMCAPTVNSPLSRAPAHAWPPGVMHAARTYSAPDIYQYPQYTSCASTRPPVMPIARPSRTYHEDGYSYHEATYQDPSVRFKPYPTMKERYPQARYEYTNYPNPFHPPLSYPTHKYDIPNSRHPYPVYPHLKYVDNRLHDPTIEQYQRPTQQSINYNMQLRNQVIHPTYSPVLGNKQIKGFSYQESVKPPNKLPIENNRPYVDFENVKTKYPPTDSYFINEMARTHQTKPQPMPNYAQSAPGLHPAQLQQLHKKDMPLKPYEYLPHYRHYEHPLGFNSHHLAQFSPNTLAISPTDSNTSNDTTQTQGTSQEDCGYVSQSSTTSVRSVETGFNRLPNEYYRRFDHRYRPVTGSSHIMHPRSEINTNSSNDNKNIDLRQFLTMWNEGEEEIGAINSPKDITTPTSELNTFTKRQEMQKSQDELYVLGLVNVPSEELSKYEHIQKISKLPENIKGYNSIELLNQFEEVINSSNLNNFKPPPPKDYNLKCKNALRQMAEVLPRPVSPLDVESKISQSVIHKEVGCNFEIKPCSPKMMNVEVAAPIQNILGERMIEKVTNPHSTKAKSPITMQVEGNTAFNKMRRQENKLASYEGPSCKMVGSPFTANNMESVKTDYSLHDLETSSGVCLASLPRLDNEIELHFPEVNQQFINANKGDIIVKDVNKCSHDALEDNSKSSPDDKMSLSKIDLKYTNIPVHEDSGTVLTKLSSYRKTKVTALEEGESAANSIRTDSVIIENPDNYRRHEEYKEKTSPNSIEEEHTPMNLTSQSISPAESMSSNMDIENNEMHNAIECALDFSISRSGNGLPVINDMEDNIIKNSGENDGMCDNDIEENGETISKDCDSIQYNTKMKPNGRDSQNATSIIIINKECNYGDGEIKLRDESTTSAEPTMKSVDRSERSGDISNTVMHNREEAGLIKNKTETNIDSEIINSEHSPSPNLSETELEQTKSCNQTEVVQKEYRLQNSLDELSGNSHHTAILHDTVIQNTDIHDGSDEQTKSNSNVVNDEKIKSNSAYLSPNNILDIPKEKTCQKEDNLTEKLDINSSVADKQNVDYSRKDGSKDLAVPTLCSTSNFLNDQNKYYNDLISMNELFIHKTNPNTVNQSFTTFVGKEIMNFSEGPELNCVEPNLSVHVDTLSITTEVSDISKLSEVGDALCENLNNDSTVSKKSNSICLINDQHIVKESVFKSSGISSSTHKLVAENNTSQNKFSSASDFQKYNQPSPVIKELLNTIENSLELNNSQINYSGEYNSNSYRTRSLSKGSTKTDTINTDSEFLNTTIAPVVETENSLSNIDSECPTSKNSFDDKYSLKAIEETDPEHIEESDEIIPINSTENVCDSDVKITVSDIAIANESREESLNSSLLNNCKEKGLTLGHEMEFKDSLSSNLHHDDDNSKTLLAKLNEDIFSESVINYLESSRETNLSNETANKEIKSANVRPIEDNSDQLDKTLETMFSENIEDIKLGNKRIETDHLADTETENLDRLDEDGHVKLTQIISLQKDLPEPIKFMEVGEDLDVLCGKKSMDIERKTEVPEVAHAPKTYSTYRGKHLNSPWIQKLMVCNECKIIETQYKNNVNITNPQNENSEDTSNSKKIIDCVHNEETLNADSFNFAEFVADARKNIKDVDSNNIAFGINDESALKNSSCCDESTFSNKSNSNELKHDVHGCDLNIKENHFDDKNQCDIEDGCVEECDIQNDLNDTEEISFSYPNSSLITHIAENIFQTDGVLGLKCDDSNEKQHMKCEDKSLNCTSVTHRRSLKRSFSDSALNTHVRQNEDITYIWPTKRNKIDEFDNFMASNRRNSVNVEENVSFCILIGNNCIIEENEEKICIAELQEDYIETSVINASNDEISVENPKTLVTSSPHQSNVDFAESVFMECEVDNSVEGMDQEWIEDIGRIETVFSDEVAENVIISAPVSPTESVLEDQCVGRVIHDDSAYSPSDEMNFIYEETMSDDTVQIKETLYGNLQSDKDKTLVSENYDSDNLSDIEDNLSEPESWKPSQSTTPDYIDPAHTLNDFRLETPENKENIYVKELSPLRRIDDYLDESSAESKNDERAAQQVLELGPADTVYHYGGEPVSCASSSFSEVSSTTSEEKSSSILLKITNLNGSRVSQINESNTRPRCKFTEKNEYSSSNLNFPNGPLITKAAQKYIPPIKEPIRDLKVQLYLPQQKLLTLKQLKKSRCEPTVHKTNNVIPIVARKPKPNFDDVLKSIDEIQIKMHKEKSKKKTTVPKVVIKKAQNGSHYASIPKNETFNPDLTGMKWQPWVFIERSDFIDKMATNKKTKAIFSHRKNTFVLAEQFKKYKSVSSTKFIISQPKASNSTGQLKYTIRLKHTY